MQKRIVVSLQVEGLHCWPECPIEEVKFLRDCHRHIFFVTAKKVVQHNDRDIEIIQLKRAMEYAIKRRFLNDHGICDFGRLSCEDLAEWFMKEFNLTYCKVLEDNENGAEIIR